MWWKGRLCEFGGHKVFVTIFYNGEEKNPVGFGFFYSQRGMRSFLSSQEDFLMWGQLRDDLLGVAEECLEPDSEVGYYFSQHSETVRAVGVHFEHSRPYHLV